MKEFLDWKFNRKKAFLKEKGEKQGNIQINVDEEEDAQSESETEKDQNTSTTDMQVEKQDQQDNVAGKEDQDKATTQTPEKTVEVNIESSTNPGIENT
jgi:hypothetical protein